MADPRELRRRDLPDWPLHRWIRWRYCWWLPRRSELRTALLDIRAWLGGWCNHCPKSERGGEPGGGYAHWRCGLRRRHEGLHRKVNYVWTDDGEADYLPEPLGHVDPLGRSPWERRHLSGSYRNRIRRMAWDRKRSATR